MSEKQAQGKQKRRFAFAAVLATAVVAIAAGVAHSATTSSKAEITPSPAFTAANLAQPASGWATNGGSTTNQRYSPLTQITSSNVKNLKGVWRTHLGGLGTAAKYSGEGQPVVWKGVLYVTTGNDDVSAISVKTGKILWQHKSNISQKISTVCCGWLNRGVGLGDGLAYIGQLDGKVVAISQSTGEQVWSTQLVQWQKGATITGCSALPRRQDLHRRRRRRLRLPRVHAADRRQDRQARLALLHDPRPERSGRRHLAGGLEGLPARRRRRLVDPCGRPQARPHVLLDGQRRQRLVRRRPQGQEPVRVLDRRARP